MSYTDLQACGETGCTRLVSQARTTMRRLTSLSNSLRELSSVIQAESEIAQENFEAVSNMCSLIFLPNELLARIFQFIVNGESGLAYPTRSKAAVTLSHVSQYFRSTALSCASLWSNISGRYDMDLLCMSRSKDALLDVAMAVDFSHIRPNPHELVFRQSLVQILPHSGRWRSLDIQFTKMSKKGQIPEGNVKTCDTFRGLNVRLLESLSFSPYSTS